MFRPLIVGFGRAGRHLHLRCLRKLRAKPTSQHLIDDTIGVVDPRIAEVGAGLDSRVTLFHSLDEVQGFDPESTVIHICTPPPTHFDVLRQVAELGYTRVLVEKPLITSLIHLEPIQELQARWNLDLLVVANWLSSALTQRLTHLVRSGEFGPLLRISIEQHKSRFSRTLSDAGHTTVFDVEMPHQVALALYLGGVEAQVTTATALHMEVGAVVIPHMGSAQVTLTHANGVISEIESDLTTHVRKRSVRLYFEDHQVVGFYPADADESFSRLMIFDRSDRLIESELLEDDPLSMCLEEYYSYYRYGGDRPASDLAFNAEVVTTISHAKTLCGIDPFLGRQKECGGALRSSQTAKQILADQDYLLTSTNIGRKGR